MKSVDEILKELKARGRPQDLPEMARYGINTDRAFGTTMGTLKDLEKKYKSDHELALALWKCGWREARLLAGLIADPDQVTIGLMDDWAREFDSWDVCDTVTSQLFRYSTHAYDQALVWSSAEETFVKRAGFVLMAGLALKKSKMDNAAYEPFLACIRAAASDERNMVKKAVNWALRQIGKRNTHLNERAIAVAEEILSMDYASARWIARDALRELRNSKVQERLQRA
ncbi:DNA alkylation repair protein [Candidatus Neomarinimicrobiota bacterium]